MNIQEKFHNAIVIAVDIDGTLCKEECWTEEQCLNATPVAGVVKKVNKLHLSRFIVVHTARRDHLIPATLKWLRTWGISFSAISNNKTSADIYIDDKAIRPEEAI